ncbi:hypothetical protein BBP40_001522 [Aspergillus hancockii]|nr:hypothetical protein BBP40_001522 [Aspergillus hancockii]
MRSFKGRNRIADVCSGSQAERASQLNSQIGEDIPVLVQSDHHIKASGSRNNGVTRRINRQVIGFNVGVKLGDFPECSQEDLRCSTTLDLALPADIHNLGDPAYD